MRNLFSLFLLFLLTVVRAQPSTQSALLPMPNSIQTLKGMPCQLPASTTLYADSDALRFSAETICHILREQMQLSCSLVNSPEKANIRLLINPAIRGEEHYTLRIEKKGITISGSSAAAIYRGVMTFHQLLLGDACATRQRQLSPVFIDDSPRFPHRALMIDPARNFLPVEDVKFFIDQMARYKYNILQLHLTDDQGWRIEIKKHPNLTPKDHFTQEQIKDLIEYAALRHIEIVPELDIPGHTVALLAAYPQVGCSSSDTIAKDVDKTTNLMLCAANEQAYLIYKDVIGEIASLFPSRYIHLGGDEAAIEANWTQCEHCRNLMKKMGYTQASQLMIPFFDRMLGYVRENKKEAILWCELDNIRQPASKYLFPYPKDVTLVTWRMGLTPTCLDLTQQNGHPIIMAPGEYAYLDYPQLKGDLPEFNNWGMPVTTLEKCYQLDPGYGRDASAQAHILGVMGTMWGEAIKDMNRLCYMTYPRGLALAEAGWTQMAHRDWESFKERMYPNLLYLMKQGVPLRVPFEIVERNKN